MKYEVYKDIKASQDYSIFEFVSTGKNKNITKRIEFTPTEVPGIFNLAFGDVDANGEIDDYSVSNNGDRNIVLATVAYTVEIYLNKYSERCVYFRGSTAERSRLYRIAIGLNYLELLSKFDVYLETRKGFVPFQKNMDAEGILVKKKKN